MNTDGWTSKLPFYSSQGYKFLTSTTYTMGEADPFTVHFLTHDCEN